MQIEYTAATPVGEAFSSKKGNSIRRWLLVSGRDCLTVVAPVSWSPKLMKTPEGQLGVCEVGGLRTENGMSSGFIREQNR